MESGSKPQQASVSAVSRLAVAPMMDWLAEVGIAFRSNGLGTAKASPVANPNQLASPGMSL